MMTLLRSTFLVKPTDVEEFFLRNYSALLDSQLGFTATTDVVIWKFVRDFVKAHAHVPGIQTLRGHFDRLGESEVVDRLEVLANIQPVTRGNFIQRLEDRAEDARIRKMGDLLRDASAILAEGLDVKEKGSKVPKHLQGPRDSFYYLMDNSDQIVAPLMGVGLSGEVLGAGDKVEEQYLTVKADPLAGIGQMTGLQQMDTLQGAKRYEFWVHAGFTGSMKSTFLLNWLYNQAVYYLHSNLMFSLEMPYIQCLNLLYAMHSYHEKFKDVRHGLGLQTRPESSVGLDYSKIKSGTLDPAEEQFFLQHVIPDFKDPKNNYGKIHIEVSDPSRQQTTMEDVRRVAERLYSKSPFSMICVDHVDNMEAVGRVKDKTEKLNEILRALKMTALYFNRGQGIAVCGLYQINRDGYKQALKRQKETGIAAYDLTSLSHSSEAERSADIVTASWVDDEMKARNRMQFQCLKTRDMVGFPMFLARVEWSCRRILTCFDVLEPAEAAKAKAAEIQAKMAAGNEDKEIDEALESMDPDAPKKGAKKGAKKKGPDPAPDPVVEDPFVEVEQAEDDVLAMLDPADELIEEE